MHPLRFPNSGIRAKGRPLVGATARKGRPPTGPADCGQPVRDGHRRPARKRLPTVHPQGAAAGRGSARARRRREPVRCRPKAAAPAVGRRYAAPPPAQGSNGGGSDGGKVRARASF
ncbi:hypothetical protein GW17_00048859 [Ensete ventricosum]|nr:hypothetical protein GW17_00048859 [Ensete ventricosum]